MSSSKLVVILSNSMSFRKQFIASLFLTILLPCASWAQNIIVYPCIDLEAIRWVRDSSHCEQYYICHFGQPLAMPSCPSGQVWSNGALNCVPTSSRWDDCSETVTVTQESTSTISDNNFWPTTTFIPEPEYVNPSDISPTESHLIIAIKHLTSVPIPSSTISVVRGDSNNFAQEEYTTLDELSHYEDAPQHWYDSERHDQIWDNDDIIESTTSTTFASEALDIYTTPSTLPQENHRLRRVLFEDKIDFLKHRLNATLRRLNIDSDHECFRQPGALLPHSENCHWYINCSFANLDDLKNHSTSIVDDADTSDKEVFMWMQPFRVRHAGVFVWECRYPQLFDEETGRCREFMNVDCRSRFEPVDQCEYSSRMCSGGRCVPCERRFGRCRSRQNGVYPLHPTRWSPLFMTCYQERNIAQDECNPPTPMFSPETRECVSLFDVPKQHGGFLPDCSSRLDGYYPDEQGRCAIFFRCALGNFRGYDECPPGSVFDPAIPACQPYSYASKPCGDGQAPLCGGKLDGLYADPYGRCTHYFQCRQGVFQQYLTCDLGMFDPLTQRCVISAELTVRPCGLQPSPCEALPTGVYPDQATGCKHFIECHHGNMITNGTCAEGTIFSAITGRCDLPEYTPPPCGVSTVCTGRPDGRYPALARGCGFFYECYNEEFVSLRRCSEADGGIFFNPETGTCDYPHNICPPCGYRWWGCPRTYQF